MGKRGPQPKHRYPVADVGCIRLDVMKLRTASEASGGVNTVWRDGSGEQIAGINIQQVDPSSIKLTYKSPLPDGSFELVEELVSLDKTPCHYGRERIWFSCPGCGGRARFLAAGERFRCRLCYPLRYPSQVFSRRENRRRKLYHLLQVDLTQPFSRIKPPGHMRVDRFRPLLIELLRIEGQMSREVDAQMASMDLGDSLSRL